MSLYKSLLYIERTKQRQYWRASCSLHLYSESHSVSPDAGDHVRGQRSSLVFGHWVSSLHHRHSVPTAQELLQHDVHEELGHDRTVFRRHPAPRPVIRDPGAGQTLPHYPALTWRGQNTCRYHQQHQPKYHYYYYLNLFLWPKLNFQHQYSSL